MVEWYRVGDDLDAGIAFLSQLVDALLGRGTAQRCSYRDAFVAHVGVDPHRASAEDLQAAARAHQVNIPASLTVDDRDTWLHLLMAEVVQPQLGIERPLILYDYPASQAALAQVRDGDPPIAERFELYCCGMELANGYHELLDADTLAARQREENAWRRRDGKEALSEHNRLLDAMRPVYRHAPASPWVSIAS